MALKFTKRRIVRHKLAVFMNNFNYRIYFEDTDAGGIVYYANYLKFYERARTDFLRARGISQQKLAKEENIGFVVRRCEIEYLSPAILDNEIEVSVEIKEFSFTIIKIYQEIKIDKKILSTLNVDLACINLQKLKPHKISQNLKDLLNV